MKGNISDNVVDEKFVDFEIDEENIKKIFNFQPSGECETFAFEENEIMDMNNLVFIEISCHSIN